MLCLSLLFSSSPHHTTTVPTLKKCEVNFPFGGSRDASVRVVRRIQIHCVPHDAIVHPGRPISLVFGSACRHVLACALFRALCHEADVPSDPSDPSEPRDAAQAPLDAAPRADHKPSARSADATTATTTYTSGSNTRNSNSSSTAAAAAAAAELRRRLAAAVLTVVTDEPSHRQTH